MGRTQGPWDGREPETLAGSSGPSWACCSGPFTPPTSTCTAALPESLENEDKLCDSRRRAEPLPPQGRCPGPAVSGTHRPLGAAGCGPRLFCLWGSEAPRRSGVGRSLPARAPSLVHSCPPHCPEKRPWGSGQGSPSAGAWGAFSSSPCTSPRAPHLGVSWIRAGLPIPCDSSLLLEAVPGALPLT